VIRRTVVFGAAMTIVLAGCSSSPAPSAAPPAPPSASVAEVAQPKWEHLVPDRLQSLWWTWASSAEKGQSPVEDTTGEFCADSQPFGVWLVAGTYGGTVSRHCQVPATLPLAGPVVNHVAKSAAECGQFLAKAKGEALVDGKPRDLERLEPVKIAYDSAQGKQEGFGCGLWVQIPPLAPGDHTLTLRGSSGSLAVEANYDLTVVRLP
jgi:hypothetical protein